MHKAPNFAPGEGCRYCNVGYVLAGLALEKVTGQGYREHVVEHVFGPAAMRTAGFFDRRDPAPDVAEGWDPVRDADGRLVTWRQNIFSYPPIGSPDGGAQVAAEDLLAFSSALRAGRLLGPAMTAAFLTPQVVHHSKDDGSSVRYGYGLEFDVSADGQVRSWLKEGINAGASGILGTTRAGGSTSSSLPPPRTVRGSRSGGSVTSSWGCPRTIESPTRRASGCPGT